MQFEIDIISNFRLYDFLENAIQFYSEYPHILYHLFTSSFFLKIWWISFSYLFIWNDAHKKSYMKWQFFFEGIVSISESFNFFQSIFRFVRKYSDLFNYIWMTFNFLSNLSITHFYVMFKKILIHFSLILLDKWH